MSGWIDKVRCTKKLEEETLKAVLKSGETYPEYVRLAIKKLNEEVIKNEKV
jgi:hypothetical protein